MEIKNFLQFNKVSPMHSLGFEPKISWKSLKAMNTTTYISDHIGVGLHNPDFLLQTKTICTRSTWKNYLNWRFKIFFQII